MNMNLLAVVTPLSIYHGCSTGKTFWEKKFTLGEFIPVIMKNCRRHNVRKHIEIKNGEKYMTLKISLKFGTLDKIKITSSEPKDCLGRSEKGLITYMRLNNIEGSKRGKGKACYY